MVKTYGLSESIMLVKDLEERVVKLREAIDLIAQGKDIEPHTLENNVQDALRQTEYTIQAFNYSSVHLLDIAFIHKYKEQMFGDISFDEAVALHYATHLAEKALLRPVTFRLGNVIEKFGLYKHNNIVWQWLDETTDAAPVPNEIGWQWQKQ